MSVVVMDRLVADHGATAMVEMTEADLREHARILDAAAKLAEESARTETDRLYARCIQGDASRYARIARDLRRQARHVNGAATVAAAPRLDPQEVTL